MEHLSLKCRYIRFVMRLKGKLIYIHLPFLYFHKYVYIFALVIYMLTKQRIITCYFFMNFYLSGSVCHDFFKKKGELWNH